MECGNITMFIVDNTWGRTFKSPFDGNFKPFQAISEKEILDSLPFFQYNKRDVFSAGQRCHAFVAYNIRKGGGFRYEDDISAEKETEIQSSWIQKENEHC